jgi:multiple sugar transport system substrate-binding protein
MYQKMSRRDFLKMAGVTVGVATLAACAPKATETAAPTAGVVVQPTSPPPAGAVTLEFWTFEDNTTGKALEILNSYIQKFEASNAGIKIHITGKPADNIVAGVIAGASSGDLPDAMQIQLSNGAKMIAVDALVDLAPYWSTMSKDYQSQFNPGGLDPCIQNGVVYGLPTTAYSIMLFRNFKVLKKAGIDPAAGVKDWDDYASQLDKVTKAGLKGTGKILGSDWLHKHYYCGVVGTGTGGRHQIAPDGKSTLLKADAYATLFEYLLKIKPYCAGSMIYDQATTDLFTSDQLAFVSQGPWWDPPLVAAKAASGLEYDAIEVAGQSADQKGTIRGGEFIGSTSLKNKDASWKWVSFFADYPQAAAWAAGIGRLVANDKALAQPEVKSNWLVQLTGKAYNNAIDESLMMKPVATGFGQPESDYGSKVDTGAITPAEAAPKMIDEINKILSAG